MSERSNTSDRRERNSPGTSPGCDSESASHDTPVDDPAVDDLGIDESGVKFRRIKILVSVLLTYHLLAVALPPLAVQTGSVDGPSPLVGNLIRPFAGYGQFLHMDRGYAFFAPDPGPSHLIQAAFTEADDSVTERMYPDLDEQWPRLLYHRHFMLAEFLNDSYFPPGPPDEMFDSDREAAEIWEQRRGRYEYIRQSLIEHLKSENQGREVQIRRIEHGLPGLQDYIAEPIALDDPRLYSVLLDQPIFSDEMAPAPTTTEEIPAPLSSGGGDSPASDDDRRQDPSVPVKDANKPTGPAESATTEPRS